MTRARSCAPGPAARPLRASFGCLRPLLGPHRASRPPTGCPTRNGGWAGSPPAPFPPPGPARRRHRAAGAVWHRGAHRRGRVRGGAPAGGRGYAPLFRRDPLLRVPAPGGIVAGTAVGGLARGGPSSPSPGRSAPRSGSWGVRRPGAFSLQAARPPPRARRPRRPTYIVASRAFSPAAPLPTAGRAPGLVPQLVPGSSPGSSPATPPAVVPRRGTASAASESDTALGAASESDARGAPVTRPPPPLTHSRRRGPRALDRLAGDASASRRAAPSRRPSRAGGCPRRSRVPPGRRRPPGPCSLRFAQRGVQMQYFVIVLASRSRAARALQPRRGGTEGLSRPLGALRRADGAGSESAPISGGSEPRHGRPASQGWQGRGVARVAGR